MPFDFYRDHYTTIVKSSTSGKRRKITTVVLDQDVLDLLLRGLIHILLVVCKQGCGHGWCRSVRCHAPPLRSTGSRSLFWSVAGSTLSSGLPFTLIRTSPSCTGKLLWWVLRPNTWTDSRGPSAGMFLKHTKTPLSF